MVVNQDTLLLASPIKGMAVDKHRSKQGVSYGLAEVGYDIRIKQEIRFDPNAGDPRVMLINGDSTGQVERGRFILASTIEEFDMPEYLVGIVHDKSTWARHGLSVFNTVIEPGWKGFLTLELVFHGNRPLIIPAGSGIAQVIFHRLTNYTSYTGSYQNQADQPVASLVR